MTLDKVRCWSGGGFQNEVWNWGDAISPYLFEQVTGRAPEVVNLTEMTTEPHLMICGSTLKWATSGSILWGIGAISQTTPFVLGDVRPKQVAAVRGPLTQKRLLEAGVPCPDVFCDPALLFPKYYQPPHAQKRYRLGIIPHYVDQSAPELAQFHGRDDVRVIDITQSDAPEPARIHRFIDQVCACDAIVSSSLHGLIIADAYGIPSKWAILSDKVVGEGFKFRDYFQSVGQEKRANAPLMGLGSAEETLGRIYADFARYGTINSQADALLAAFPFDLVSPPTDINRWERTAQTPPAWDRRNVLIAQYLSPQDAVLDFGAGHQTIREHARPRHYWPVDCVPSNERTFVCDYNKDTQFPKVQPDVIVMSGFLEYLLDVPGFLAALRDAYPGTRCLFSWAFAPTDLDARKHNGWLSPFAPKGPHDPALQSAFTNLKVLEDYKTQHTHQIIFEGWL
ncbi:polysaccharide pyruvyl transferase family protein [Tropicibacter naphthalenivorans]|uniref:Polysaccharide pyruvyl transferase n=1 Tax=Tropicibacter naphthalenivorans TaxID=441103 RepID=A0A0N7M116_9RHOB|nr:polysaccharide pyruvyl transferase family protein [Tropicibacter naphthalenivorans]CUH82009.1 Polysaccharide pyruvyl transferase [Tropicibacter naphthalenivorans]SMD07705.1 Polysaccharide pyruvyl transferase [Tropicibacter naphthalenivorans]